MNEELEAPIQSEIANDVIENEQVNNLESSKESDLSPEKKTEKVTFSDEQQNIFNDAIGKSTKRLRETERKLEESEHNLRSLKSTIPDEIKPNVPDVPDRYDYDDEKEYLTAVGERDNSIRAAAQFDANETARANQAESLKQQAIYDNQVSQQKDTDELVQRAAKNGVTEKDIFKAAAAVGVYQLSADLSDAIVKDHDGDVILMYLAENPVDADKLSRLGSFDAARMLDTVIRDKAQTFKASPVMAPDPSKIITGSGSVDTTDGILKGVKFE